MADEIINRVANSKLKTFDLEDLYPQGTRVVFDIKDWLWEELVLKEKDFRAHVKAHDWTRYENAYVAITCSTDAIVPTWAYMLVALHLQDHAKMVVHGSLEALESLLYQNTIQNLDLSAYENAPVIVKGCANKPVPTNAYLMLIAKLKTVAKSIMYGEACSSVPLFKRK